MKTENNQRQQANKLIAARGLILTEAKGLYAKDKDGQIVEHYESIAEVIELNKPKKDD